MSGTGTSGMEAVVANLAEPGRRALVVVTGYFGDRLAGMFARYGATVDRVDGEWGRAIDPAGVAARLRRGRLRPGRRRPRRNIDGRRQSGGGHRGTRARARRADGGGRRHVARRDPARSRRVANRRVLLLLAEGPRRAVGHGARRLLRARAGAPRQVPQLLPRSRICSSTSGSAASITTRSPRRWSTRWPRRWPRSKTKDSRRGGRRHDAVHDAFVDGARRASDCRCCPRRPNGSGA